MTTTSVISTFPIELTWKILLLVEDRDDLVSLALVNRHFYETIVPDFLDYHTIKCSYNKRDVWTHLIKQSASWKVVKTIFLLEDNDLRRKFIPRACKVRQPSNHSDNQFASALSHFSNLQSFTLLDQSRSNYEGVFKTLANLNPPLKTLVLVDSSNHYQLPLNHLKPSNVSQLTRLEIISEGVVDNSDSLVDILLHAENLNRLALNVPFDITDALRAYTWTNLKHLFLGNRVEFFSTTLDDSNENRLVFTAFFKRHPLLEWLSLPLAADLNDSFPLEEDIFPNLRVLEWDQITPVPPSRNFAPPASIARRLVHYSSMFGGGWLPAFRDMSNLQSCCLGIDMDQVKYLETLFQYTPRITKLRIELIGSGIQLYSRIQSTINIILKMNLPLTHLLSLFDDVDMSYQTGKEVVERVAQIPTLEYTTGCLHGKTVFLKIIRRYHTYTGFDILYDPETVNDPYLTSWGKF